MRVRAHGEERAERDRRRGKRDAFHVKEAAVNVEKEEGIVRSKVTPVADLKRQGGIQG